MQGDHWHSGYRSQRSRVSDVRGIKMHELCSVRLVLSLGVNKGRTWQQEKETTLRPKGVILFLSTQGDYFQLWQMSR